LPDTKISALTALTGANVAADDVFAIVDTSASETKKIRADQAKTYINGTSVVGYNIQNSGSAITTGVAGTGVQIPFACTITGVTLLANTTGSVVIDIWKDTYANFPPTVADTICAAAKPTLSSATKYEDNTLTGWTTSIAAGDVLYFNVDSASTISSLLITLKVTKT
jgi:hypothetical protein